MKRDRKAIEAANEQVVRNLNPEQLKETRSSLPNQPGVYQFYSATGKILYIGKAKNLKKRVNSYFTKQTRDYKTNLLVSKIRDIRYVVTNNENEALILENNLIKQHQPRYNILLKDGKSYPYIVIKNERFPRVFSTRKKIEDGSQYFGPYPSYTTMSSLLHFIRENFKVRTCHFNLTEENIRKGKFRPCLEYHIKKCKAPCVGWQTEEEYNSDIEQIRHLLKGHYGAVQKFLREEMKKAAEQLQFERAAELKYRLGQVKKRKEQATVVSEKLGELEVLTLASQDELVVVNHFKVEHGTIVNTHAFTIRQKNQESRQEIFEAVLSHLLSEDPGFAPLLITNLELNTEELPEGLEVQLPKIGDKRKLVELSMKNCQELLKEKADVARLKKRKEDPMKRTLEQLQTDLRLVELPYHIECFDNSNIQGSNPVASCVVFKNGRPSKKDYRSFKIKTVLGPDDFASMKEVVGRRYKRLRDKGEPLPDLVVIDGGKGQLSHAMEALEELGLAQKMAVVGIAKRLEEIYFKDDPVPLYIDKTSPSLRLLQNARNEAHRFAVNFHRKRHSNNTLKTSLTEVPGIGKKTAQKLLQHFGSVKGIRQATQDELAEVVGPAKAQSLLANFIAADQAAE